MKTNFFKNSITSNEVIFLMYYGLYFIFYISIYCLVSFHYLHLILYISLSASKKDSD